MMMMMIPCQTLQKESTQRKGEKKKQRARTKVQATEMRWARRRKGNH